MGTGARAVLGRAKLRGVLASRTAFYRFAYDRSFPGRDRWERQVTRWESELGAGDVPKDRAAWDAQYDAGGWDFLSGLSELAHYSVIVGYADRLRPHGSVLDVGCGSGVLHERFRSVGYAAYLGLDISEAAVSRLRAAGHADAEFVAERAEDFETERRFDVVVFNESLTYLEDPVRQFGRYVGFAAPGGIAVVSCHVQSARAQAVLRELEASYDVVDACVVAHGDTSWRVVAISAG